MLRERIEADWNRHSRVKPGPGASRAAFRRLGALVLAFAVGACATFAGSDEEELAPPTSTVQDADLLLPPIPEPSPSSGVLRGRSLLADGRYSEAARQFEWVLTVEPARESRADALWGLSLVHLLPDSPLREPDQADALLEALADEFPDTLPGMQAVWLRSILEDLRIATERAAAHERAVRELEETLEQLRQIDLGRRPSGRSTPEPDS